MAVLAIGMIGSFIGNAAIAGTVLGMSGAAIGWTAATMAASALMGGGSSTTQGPRLTDLKVADASVGGNIPRIYGSARVAGNYVWLTPLRETKHSQTQGGKGGGKKQTVESFTYDQGVAVAFAVGPGVIRKLWINRELAYDASATDIETLAASNQGLDGWRFYNGDETQLPDPDIQAWEQANPPEGQPPRPVPGFRGLIYMVNPSLQLAEYGNRTPSIEAEIVADVDSADHTPRILKQGYGDFSTVGSIGYEPGRLFASYSGGHSGYVEYGGIGFFLVASNDFVGGGQVSDLTTHGFTVQAQDIKPSAVGANNKEFTFDFDGKLIDTGSALDNLFSSKYGAYVSTTPAYHVSGGTPQGSPWIYPFWDGLGSVSGSPIFYCPQAPDLIGVAHQPMRADYSGVGAGPSYTSAKLLTIGKPGVNGVDLGGLDDALVGAGEQGRRIVGAAVAADGSSMMLFTCAAGAAAADRWLRINVAGGSAYVVDNGTCDPADQIFDHFGGVPAGSQGMALEEDGQTLWRALFRFDVNRIQAQLFRMDENTKHLSLSWSEITNVAPTAGLQGAAVFAKNGLAMVFSGSFNLGFCIMTRTPNISRASIPLADIVADQLISSGLAPERFDVSQLEGDLVDGFTVASAMTARAAIEPLQAAYFFDAVDTDTIYKFVKRGGPVVADIPEEDLAAHDGAPSELPDALGRTRAQSQELPQEFVIRYPSTDGAYQVGTQYARRLVVQSAITQNVDLPICMSDDKAARVAATNLAVAWLQAESFTWTTTRKYAWIDPTDVVKLHKGDNEWIVRVTKRSEGANGMIQWEGVEEDPEAYKQTVKGAPSPAGEATISLPGPTDLRAIDAPTLRDTDGASPAVLFVAAPMGSTKNWGGASLWQSEDGGASYSDTGAVFNQAAAIGVARTLLPAPPKAGSIDIFNHVDVAMSSGELESISSDSLMRGGNVCMIGGEVLAFGTAELIAQKTYRLSKFLRGLKGTQDKAASHAAGDGFVLLTARNSRLVHVPGSDIGQTLQYKAPSSGQSLSDAKSRSLAFTGRNMLPLAPVFPNAFKNTSAGDWTLNWRRCTRIGGDWRAGVDAELGEASELYDVEIMFMPNFPSFAASSVKRTISNVSAAQLMYTSAMQTEDWGGPVNQVAFRVYQRSSVVGRGLPAQSTQQWFAPSYSGGSLSPFTGALSGCPGSLIGAIGNLPASALVPEMTTNTTPYGLAFVSSAYFSTPAWCAFAAPGPNGCINNGDGLPWLLGYQHTTPRKVQTYDIQPWDADNFPSRCPTSWKIQGSNDGSTWFDIDTVSGYTSWVFATASSFTVDDNSTAYLMHRINVSANGGNAYTGLRRLQFFGQ